MNQDIIILRELASKYAEIAWKNTEIKVWDLHADLNDLRPQRPIVLISELPWHELNADGSLTLHCQDPIFREVEDFFRRSLFQYQYFPGDMIIKPYYPVRKIINSTGIGVDIQEETLASDSKNAVVSHKYTNQFQSMDDLEKLHNPVISYDKEQSLYKFAKISEAIADILPVKLVGAETGYGMGHGAWDIIATFMGVDDLLINLVDEPELMHGLVEKLTDIFTNTMQQYENLNLLNADAAYVHCSSSASRDLTKNIDTYEHVKLSHLWGRGYAQILASVSPAMHDEFEIQYARKSLAPFGLVYYGCCEPLDRKIDIIKQIPNLRKISITPWANIDIAADAIGKDYVISAKPNPANLLTAASNPDVVRKELRHILQTCKAHGCPCELLLKDISTVGYNLENLIVWNQIAKEEIENC